MVYKRQLDFKHSYPSGCDTSKLLSDDLKNKLYYDGFQKVLYHYSHQYDSYYLIMGDSNFDWCMVTSGTWESNNKLILKYEKEYEGGQWVVILQKTDDGYLFISNQKAD